jgi:Holliday junction DNA helicase RuvA
MISYLFGKIIIKKEKFVIVDIGSIGYKIYLSKKNLPKMPSLGESIKIFCHLNVRENVQELYGFLTYEELEFFEVLVGINGVGPKIALEISSLGTLEGLKERILAQDEKIFEGIPGIGKKRAMTIILELTGKINEFTKEKKVDDEAEEGLIKLGFSKQKAKEALLGVGKNLDAEQRIKGALKNLN